MSRNQAFGASGGRGMQSGIPRGGPESKPQRAGGLMLSGVVTAVYVPLDGTPAHPQGSVPAPVAVYADVLVYSSMENFHNLMVRRALVAGGASGIHGGHVWKPRAARVNVADATLRVNQSDPKDLDGDHVLVQFLEDNLAKPVVVGLLPHPRTGLGNEGLPQAGHRQRLKVADGDPAFWKHHGTFHGVDSSGNFVVDATRAHGGELTADGKEVPAEDTSHGSVTILAAATAKVTVKGLDKSGRGEKFSLVLEDDKLTVLLGGGASLVLEGKDGAATMAVGDGAKHVAIVEALRDLFNSAKTQFTQLKSDFDAHKHEDTASTSVTSAIASDATASTTITHVTPTPSTANFPDWDSSIESGKISIPDG